MEIHNREFKKGFRGYNENEVDEFLDRIVVDYEKVLRENEKLRDKLTMNDKEVENYKKLEKNLQDTLSVAQKTADEILDSAKKTSKEMRDNAVRDTQSIYDNTLRETKNMREQAQLESKRMLDDAAHKLKVIVTEYEKLVREKNAFLLKIRTALESELAVTTQLLGGIPHIEELATIKAELTKIETGNKVMEKSIETPAKVPEKKVDTKKAAEPEDDVLIEKVSQIVAKAEPLEKTDKVEEPKPTKPKIEKTFPKTEKTFSNAQVYANEKNGDVDLDKNMTFQPIKKSSE